MYYISSYKTLYIKLLTAISILVIQPAFCETYANNKKTVTTTEMVRQGKELMLSNPDSAMTLFTKAFKLYDNSLDETEKYGCADAYLQAGNINFMQRNYILALQLYISGLKICEHCSDKSLLPRFYNNIGNVYGTYQDYESSINFYEKGVRYITPETDKNAAFNLYINLCGACSYIDAHSKAKKYYDLAFKTKHKEDSVYNYLKNYHYGLLMLDKNDIDSAKIYLKLAEKDAKEKNLPVSYICNVYEEMYQIHKITGEQDKMFGYLEKCRKLAEENNYHDIMARAYKRLSYFYDKTGQHDKAMEYKSRYVNLYDSIFNQRQYYSTKSMHLLYEGNQLQQKIASLDVEKKHKEKMISMQRIIITTVSTALLAIILLLLWIYGQNKKLQMSYRNLFKINEEIIASDKKSREMINKYEKMLSQKEEKDEKTDNKETDEENCGSKYMASRLSTDVEQRILHSIRHIMEDTEEFCNEDFSLDKLAEMVESNSKYVSQVINTHYNKNFSSYVNEYRIRKACTRLTDTGTYSNYTIQAIAESVGYKSHSTFVKIFRKITGITPSIYKNLSQEQDFHLSIQE